MTLPAGQILSSILRHDRKQNSYKFALLRSINDIVLSFPELVDPRPSASLSGPVVSSGPAASLGVALPLRMLAELWVGYYWPFVDPAAPIRQGPQSVRGGVLTSDMAFRASLTELRRQWELTLSSAASSADGFFVQSEMWILRRCEKYALELPKAYDTAVREIVRAIEMPIRYTGPAGSQWSVFAPPRLLSDLPQSILRIPGAIPSDLCLVLTPELWQIFLQMSLWVEALCIHEWCLFTEQVAQDHSLAGGIAERGEVYRRLTARPGNRRPLTWERNQVDLLLLDGHHFVCPWTERSIIQGIPYDLDHLLPVSIYPINELWNLVPCDPVYNSQGKRDRLPSPARLTRAEPLLAGTYAEYGSSPALKTAFNADVFLRFGPSSGLTTDYSVFNDYSVSNYPASVARKVVGFL